MNIFSEPISYFFAKTVRSRVLALSHLAVRTDSSIPHLLNIRTFFPFYPTPEVLHFQRYPTSNGHPSCCKQVPRTRSPMLPPVSYFPVRSRRTRASSLRRPTLNYVLPSRSLQVSSHLFLGILSYFSLFPIVLLQTT